MRGVAIRDRPRWAAAMSVKFGIEQGGRDAFLAVLQFQDHVTACRLGTPPDPDDVPLFGGGVEGRRGSCDNLKHPSGVRGP